MNRLQEAQSQEFLEKILSMPDDFIQEKLTEIESLFTNNLTASNILEIVKDCRLLGTTEEEIMETYVAIGQQKDQILALPDISDIKKQLLLTVMDSAMEMCSAILTGGLRMNIPVYIQTCRETAVIPTYARKGDAGADLYAAENIVIEAGETKLVPLGIKVVIPQGYEWQIRPRSGFTLKAPSNTMIIPNSPGTIDAGYRDEVCVIMRNLGTEPFAISIGDRIAQAVLMQVPKAQFTQVEDITSFSGNRGGGFGHTGD